MRPKLKICGLTSTEQAVEIALMGVDALGFILYPGSPRYIEPKKLKALIQSLPTLVKTVGVFVNCPKEEVLEICRYTGLDLAQLHGSESPSDCRWLSRMGQPWLKALRVGCAGDLLEMDRYETGCFLLDAKSTKAQGGTGETFDWSLAKQAARRAQVILAGGLEIGNLQDAVQQVRPYGLDLSSSVEVSPGVKDLVKVKALVKLWRTL